MDWHPLIVHFPIVLLISAVLLDLTAIVASRPALHTAGMILFIAGAVTAVPAAFTGEASSETAVTIEGIADDLARHENVTTLTAWLAAGLSLARVHLSARKQFDARIGRVWLFAAALCAILAGWSGYTGGLLVYQYGAGTLLIEHP